MAGISRRGSGGRAERDDGAVATVVMSYSFHKLPKSPMMPRLCDNRVGYFSMSVMDYSRPDQRGGRSAASLRGIGWRRRTRSRALSEPVKQIVYYLDREHAGEVGAVADQGYRGLAAGVRGGGVQERDRGKEAPKNDPDWSPEDARYSVMRWLPSTTENAIGT